MNDNLSNNFSRKCISCKSFLTDTLVNIGEQYPSAIFLQDKSERELGLERSSLDLARCSDEYCSLVQLTQQIDLEIVYKNYPYQSAGTATMHQILSDVANEAIAKKPLFENDVVLDIGGNDGSLLNLIKTNVKARVNIDAASNIEQIPKSENYHYVNTTFSKDAYSELDLPAPKLIFCVAVFYQLHDPLQFCLDIHDTMDKESVFILQMTYLESMLQNNIFDNIVHEHTSYYSLYSLENLLSRSGLKAVGAKIVESYGGSLRVYIKRKDSINEELGLRFNIDEIRATEMENSTNTYEALFAFDSRFKFWRYTMKNLIDYQFKTDGPVVGLGASTKGNMILQALEIDSSIMPYILDNNTKKIGSKTTGSNIPIIDENSINVLPNNILNLPYYYKNFFISMLTKKLNSNQYINFITPLSFPEILRLTGADHD